MLLYLAIQSNLMCQVDDRKSLRLKVTVDVAVCLLVFHCLQPTGIEVNVTSKIISHSIHLSITLDISTTQKKTSFLLQNQTFLPNWTNWIHWKCTLSPLKLKQSLGFPQHKKRHFNCVAPAIYWRKNKTKFFEFLDLFFYSKLNIKKKCK